MEQSLNRYVRQPNRSVTHFARQGVTQGGKLVKGFLVSVSVASLLSFAQVGHADATFEQCLENAKTSHERSECFWARSRQQRGR